MSRPARSACLWLCAVLVVACLDTPGTQAQDLAHIDSLHQYITRQTAQGIKDTTLLTAIGDLAYALAVSNTDSALVLTREGVRMCQDLNDIGRMVWFYAEMGQIYHGKSDFFLALEFQLKAFEMLVDIHEERTAGWLLLDVGNTAYALGGLEFARECFEQSLVLFDSTHTWEGQAVAINNLGLVKRSLDSPESALPYFLRALEIRKNHPHDYIIGHSYYLLGETCFMMKDYDGARDYLGRALASIAHLESLQPLNGEEALFHCEVHRMLGVLFSETGDAANAEMNFRMALERGRALKKSEVIARILNDVGDWHRAHGRTAQAIAAFAQADTRSWERADLEERKRALLALTRLYLETGDKERAGTALADFVAVSDTIRKNAIAVNFKEVKLTMDFFRLEREYGNLRNRNWNELVLFGGISLVLLFGLALMYIGFTHKRKYADRLRDLSNSTFEGIIIHDNGLILDANEKACELLLVPMEQLIGRMFSEFIDPEFHARMLSTLSSQRELIFEMFVRDSNGQRVPVEVMTRQVMFKGRGVRVAAMRDITDRKQAETQLRESERKVASLVGNLPGLVYRCLNDEHRTMLFLSEGCHELTGYHPVDIINNRLVSFNDIILEEYRLPLQYTWNAVLAARGAFDEEYRIRTSQGKVKWVWEKGAGVFAEDGALIALEGLITDITPRKNTEYALRNSEEQFRLVVETFPFPMALAGSRSGRITYANLECVRVFELEAGTRHRYCMEQFFVDRAQFDRIMRELATVGYINSRDLQLRRASGQEFWATGAAVVTHIGGENVIVIALNDITDRKLTEEQLRRAKETAESLAHSKSTFLANMSHEIRTPMNAIIGFTELLREHVREPQLREYLRGIATSGGTLLNLINNILDLSKIEAGRLDLHLEPVDIRELVDDMLVIFRHRATRKNLALEARMAANVPPLLLLDDVRMRQILLNLMGNALKFTETGGVRVDVSVDGAGGTGAACALTIAVHDTGIGIPEHQRSIIFEAFRQTDGPALHAGEGTGLGLSIAKRLVEMMNGRIELESRSGEGSTFIVRLPNVVCPPPARVQAVHEDPDDHAADAVPDAVFDDTLAHPDVPKLDPALIAILREKVAPALHELKDRMIYDDIRRFAGELQTLAREREFGELAAYAVTLQRTASSFDVDETDALLRRLEHFLTSLPTPS